jgi:predicted nucleic acid-binding protein
MPSPTSWPTPSGGACGFSISFEITEAITTAIRALEESAWQAALTPDGVERDRAHVVELTDTVALPDGWPEPARLVVRREPPHPGAQQTIDDLDGCRFTAVLTDQAEVDVVAVERRHRARARAEDRIRALNQLGMANLACGEFARHAAWLHLTLIALNLLAWTQTLTLDGELARAEPKRVRYQLAHIAARVTRSARRTTLALAADWRWTPDLLAAFARLRALPPAPP